MTPAEVIGEVIREHGAGRPHVAADLVLAHLEASGFVVVDVNAPASDDLDAALRYFLAHTRPPSGAFGQSVEATMAYDASRRLRAAAAKHLLRDLGDPPPSLATTYKRADGETVGDDYGWVTDLEFFEADEEPVELVVETWNRATVRRFWHLPPVLGSCEIEDAEPCDDDATSWWRSPDGEWLRVCEEHRPCPCCEPDGAHTHNHETC